jgi:sugar lactone lactonase YvrE
MGVAVDAAGNVFVADRGNHRIRKITPTGFVSNYAGTTAGNTDGIASVAKFNSPYGVAVDAAGNVYVADYINTRIRKIDPTGFVSTLAGSTFGYTDGQGAAAQFSHPTGVTVDGAGNVYVADAANKLIRKIDPTGLVSTLAGSSGGFADGPAANAMFQFPWAVAVDAAGKVFVADAGNHIIRSITPPVAITGYLWSNGETTASISAIAAGSYTVQTISDGCTSAVSDPIVVTLTTPPATPTITPSGSTTLCNGESLTLTAPWFYEYIWSTNETTESINVTTPGTYTVRTIDAGCTSAVSAPIVVTVNGPNTPTITPSGPTTFCSGGSVTLTAPTGFEYLWSTNETTESINVTAGGSYTVQTIASGCTSAASAPLAVTISSPSAPTITASGPTTFCVGGSVMLSAPAGFEYLWSTNETTQSINVTVGGNYTVQTIASGCTSAVSAPIGVIVNNLPARPTIRVTGSTTFCAGGSVSLGIADPTALMLWSTGATSQFIQVTTSGSYTLRYIDFNNGCTSAVSAAVVVNVLAAPSMPTITPNGPTTFCTGGSVLLTAPLGFSYRWSNNATSRSITVTNSGSYTVRTIASGCTSAISAATVVTVNTPPSTPTITAGGPTTFCPGGSVTLSAPTGFSYLWSTNETSESINVTGAGSYTVRTIANGCTSAVSAATVVNFNTQPSAPIITPSGPTTFCTGGSVTLTAPTGFEYLWSTNETTESINVPAGGSYTVQTIASGCTSAVSAPVEVTVNTTPPKASLQALGSTTLCTGGSVTLQAPAFQQYIWSTNETTEFITVSTAGTYSVRTISNGCTSAASDPIVVTLSSPPSTPTITAGGPTTFCTGGSVMLTAPASTATATVSTLAGSTLGFADGQGTDALFSRPYGIARDAAGNVYVADQLNHRIRKIDPSGLVSTLAGSFPGNADGQGTSARFAFPTGVFVDASGNVYVADQLNHRICKIDPSGLVSTLAGSTQGYADGHGTAAMFNYPASVAVDAEGNVYVADQNNHRIRKIDPSGLVSTLAGSIVDYADGQGVDARFNNPSGVAVDAAGNIYVADQGNHRIRKIDPSGLVSTLAGATVDYVDGQGVAARFRFPAGVAVDAAGNVYVADAGNHRIRKIDPTGLVSTLAGSTQGYADGPSTNAQFNTPFGVAVDAAGNVYVPDWNNHRIRSIANPAVITGYFWSNGATTASITATTNGSYTVRTIANGCTSAASAATVVTLTSPSSTPTITAGGPTTFCTGGFVTLSAPAGFSYLWSNNETTESINVTSAGSYTVQTIASGCTSVASDPIVVTLSSPPSTPSITAGGPTTFCTGGSVTLSTPAGYEYLWSTNETTESINVTAGGSYTVQTIANGCTSAISTPIVVSISAGPNTPTITASGSTTFCAGGSVTLSAPAGYEYLWSTNETTESINITAAGSYSVKVISNGCTSVASAPIVVSISGGPSTPTVTAGGPTTFCTGGSVNLSLVPATVMVSTLAGSTEGFANGQGVAAQFNRPRDVAMDAAGNIYLTDRGNHLIRKIDPTGLVSTFAGSTAGYADGQGTNAMFNGPSGIAVDAAGNVYVTDGGNNRIRKIDPTGLVSTLAGSTYGFADGQGSNAMFRTPYGLAVDAVGNVYVADQYNHRIRKIDPTGLVSTLAGSTQGFAEGQGAGAQFGYPQDVALDAAGNVYVTDADNFRIRKIDPSGLVSTFAGSSRGYEDRQGTNAKFYDPTGIAVDAAGNVYISDLLIQRIRKIDPAGLVSTLAGSSEGYVDGQGTDALFYNPSGLAVDASGKVVVVDVGNNRIRVITEPSVITGYVWSNGSTTASLSAIESGSYSVRTISNGCTSGTSAPVVVTVNSPSMPSITAGGPTTFCPGGSVTLSAPAGFSYLWSNNATTQSINVTAAGSYTVRTIASGCTSAASAATVVTLTSPPSTPSITAGGPTTFCPGGSVTLSAPAGFSYLWSNNETTQSINVTTAGGYSVRTVASGCTSATSAVTVVIISSPPSTPTIIAGGPTNFCTGGSVTLSVATQNAMVSTLAGSSAGFANGQGTNAMFDAPRGVALDAAGNVYVSDALNHLIRKIDPTGLVSTFAGSTQGSADGQGVAAQFNSPRDVAIDAAGNVYVVDQNNHRIRKIDPTGLVSTLAGSSSGNSNGQGVAAKFSTPTGLALDAAGNVYVAENHRIRKIDPTGLVSTLAGSSIGFADGQGTAASFNFPTGIAVDVAGNVYVGDQGNHRIRKISPTGLVSTLAGSSTSGFVDGPGVIARFNAPSGLSVDAAGNIYVADFYNHRIRKVTSTGVVSTLAGSSQGSSDGLATNALFNNPLSLAVGPDARIYVADRGNHQIRILTQPVAVTGYLWNSGATTASRTISASGSYTVRTIASGCTSATSDPIVVTINSLPSRPTVTAGGPTTFCTGGSVTLSAPAGFSYLWSNNETTQSINVTTAGSYTLRTIANGCTSSISAATLVTVNTSPSTPSITASGPTTFCIGGSVTLNAPAGFSYLWSTNETTESINVTAGGTYTVRTIASGCTSAAVDVTVNTLPGTPGITAGGPTTFCTGGSVTLSAPAGFAYLWSNNATTQSINVTAAGSYTVQTIASGCTSTVSAAVDVTVNTPPLPTTIFTFGSTALCSGGSVTLYAPHGYFYLWSNNATTETINVTTAGSYTVRVIINGCTSAASDPIVVTLSSPPSTPTVTAGGPTTFCSGGSVSLSIAPEDAIVSTFAGSFQGSTDGQGTAARFYQPNATAIDNTGNIYLADSRNNQIRKITPGGLVSTFAGSTSSGFADGQGTAAQFSGPTGVAVDATGNVYVADRTNRRIRKISPEGLVSTLAGSSTDGSADGQGDLASFSLPSGIALDAAGIIYVADQNNHRIRKITPGGLVSTLAGSTAGFADGQGSAAQFSTPRTVAVDAAGNVYVGDISNHRIRKIMPTGLVSTLAGSTGGYADGQGSAAQFLFPNGVAVDAAGNVYVADGLNNRIRKISPTGLVSTLAGSTQGSANGVGSQAKFSNPSGVTLDADGNLLVADFDNNRIRKITIPASPSGYVWSDGATTASLNATTSGSYTVRTISNGCTSATSAPVVVTVNAVSTPSITASGPTTFCTGGSVTLNAPAGFSYLWSNNATTQSINVTSGGSYTVRTIASGCTSAVSAAVDVTVNTPPLPTTIFAFGSTALCSGGSVTLNAPYGYDYLWSNNATTESINVTTPGSYSARIILNGCTSAASIPIVVTLSSPPSTPTIVASGPTTFCTGGSVTLTAPAGFAYLWSNSATTQSINVTAGGSYTVRTIANGCTSAVSVAVNVTLNTPTTRPNIIAIGASTICAGSGVTLYAGGTDGLIEWSNGDDGSIIYVTTPGTYYARSVKDGCVSANSDPFVVGTSTGPSTPTITASGPTALCLGDFVTLTAPAGFSYLWSNNQTTQSIFVSASGSYTVQTIINTCTSAVSAPVEVTVGAQPADPTVTASGPTTFCTGGSVTLSAPAGFSYLWSNNATTQSINVTTGGSFSVQVINNGCRSAFSAPVVVSVGTPPSEPIVTASGPTTFCAGGSVTLSAPAGFSYLWSNNETTQSINVLTTGLYSVRTILNGCTSQVSEAIFVNVTAAPATPIISEQGLTTFCAGGGVILSASNGIDYIWSTNETTDMIYVTTSGSYTVRAIVGGCTSAVSAPMVVTVNTPPSAPTVTAGGPTTFCTGGSVTLSAPAGFNYLWSTNETTQSINVTASGSYTVRTIASGCTSAISAATVVTVNTPPTTPSITAGGPTSFVQGGSVTLQANLSAGTPLWSTGATTNTITVSTSGSYTLYAVSGTCSSTISSPVVVTVVTTPQFIFSGTGLWTSTSNWSGGQLPSATDSAVVAVGANVTVDGLQVVKSLKVLSGANVRVLSDQTVNQLTVREIFDCDGTFNSTSSMVLGGGSRNVAIIKGSSPVTFSSLRLAQNTLANMAFSITDLLDIDQYQLDATSLAITLKSTVAKTASLVASGAGAVVNGNNFKVERWIDANKMSDPTGGWCFVAAPVQNQTVSVLAQRSNTFATNTFNQSSALGGSVYFYSNQRINGRPDANGFIKPMSASSNLSLGDGVRVWVRKPVILAAPLVFQGAPRTGTFTFGNLSFCSGSCTWTPLQNGWNLVGNPFAAELDWDNTTTGAWTKTGLSNEIHTWTNRPTGAVYASYVNGVGVNGGRSAIASGQSFYVVANQAAPTMTVSQLAIKRDGANTFLRSGVSSDPLVRIKLMSGTAERDEVALRLNADATTGYDATSDASKMLSGGPSLALVAADGKALAIDARPEVADQIIPIDLAKLAGLGLPNLQFTGINSLGQGKLYLEHPSMPNAILISEGMTFDLSDTTYHRGLQLRHRGTITGLGQGLISSLKLYPNPSSGQVTVSGLPAMTAFLISNALGQTLMTATMPANSTDLSLDLSRLPNGIYLVQAPGFGVTKLVKE